VTPWRRLAIRLHLWGGLVMGPLIVALGVSGMALVFRMELEQIVDGTPAVVSTGRTARSFDGVVRAAHIRYPAAEPRALHVPAEADRPYRVELMLAGPRRVDVSVNPYTLDVLQGRAPERSLLVAVHSLHTALHGGRTGAIVVGVLGVWLIVESLTGLWLCWPAVTRRPSTMGVARVRSTASRAVHQLVGGLSLTLGVIVACTGTVLAIASAFALAAVPAPVDLFPTGGLRGLDAIADRADATLPGGRISAFVVDARGTIRVEKSTGAVVVEREGGAVIAVRTNEARGAWHIVRRLHYGDFAGWPSRVAYALVGLALPMLSVTGYLISARRAR
jgi:uncharacterized iron-regulated membrane protein